MLFTTEGDEQSEEFDFYEDIIVNSIITYPSKDVRSPEEDSAEKATEPETEPPYRKTYKKLKNTLTELYSDSDVAVYYSDTEQAPYSDEEVDVHLYVKKIKWINL